MKERLKKYIEGHIKFEEIEALQKEVESMSDSELNEYIDKLDCSISFQQNDIKNLQTKINNEINLKQKGRDTLRFFITCAASLIPFILILGIVILNKNKSIDQYKSVLAQKIEISTNKGEYVTTILPDGSKVYMGPESSLSYILGEFNKEERRIQYSGEGDFKIVKVPESSFFLYSSDFKIQVIGTEFSVFSRSSYPNTEIYLDKGSIQLTALASNISKMMQPGETAIINNMTGGIQLFEENSNIKRIAGQDVMYFTSSSLYDVAEGIELYYGYDVIIEKNKRNISFTGSLPTNDFDQVAYILENTLNIEITIDDESKKCIIK